MRNKSLLIASLLFLSTSITSCGGGGGNGLNDICAPDGLFGDSINGLFDCQPIIENFFPRPDPATLAAVCRDSYQPFLDDGTITVDAAAVDACRSWLSNIDCNTYDLDGPSPCTDVFVGTQPIDGACDISEQCEGDAYCNSPAPGCGTCTARVAIDNPCSINDECTSTLCSNMRCRPRGDIGDSCLGDTECSGPSVCNLNNLCEANPPAMLNDPCTMQGAGQCDVPYSGLYCDGSNCVAVKAVDAGCALPEECNYAAYEFCDLGMTDICTAPTTVNLGENCNPAQGLKCADNLLCTGVCVAVDTVGSACTDSCNQLFLECVGGLCQYGEYTGMCSGA